MTHLDISNKKNKLDAIEETHHNLITKVPNSEVEVIRCEKMGARDALKILQKEKNQLQ